MSCGKPKNDGNFPADQIFPRTVVTEIPHQHAERIKSNCYLAEASGNLIPNSMLNGSFYRGAIYQCHGEPSSCMGHGVYVHYFLNDLSCVTKKGFEEQYTLCLKGLRPDQRSSNVGTLVRLDLTIETVTTDLWCEENILQIMLKENSEA